MTDSGNYGKQLAKALHIESGHSFVTRTTLQYADIAVTEIERDIPEHKFTSPVPYEDAFLVALNIRRQLSRGSTVRAVKPT
jgi:hypothetical protein